MANQWLRLWHELPHDPKWRIIATKSEQPISLVISVYIHMLVNASQSDERGTLQNWCDEDIAVSLNVEPNAIERIRTHMNAKVLDGDKLIGWERRQPIKDDGAAERARAWRERKKSCANANERSRTQTNVDKDKDKDKEYIPPTPQAVKMAFAELPIEWRRWATTETSWSDSVIDDTWTLFRDYWQTGKGRATKRQEWSATWRQWVRKEFSRQPLQQRTKQYPSDHYRTTLTKRVL